MRQARILLLTLAALVLPVAALANSNTFFNTGSFSSGLITNVNASQGLNAGSMAVNLLGSKERFRLTNMTLSSGCATAAAGICTFTGGTLDVFSGSTMIFTSSLENGQVIKGATSDGEGTAVLTADLVTQPLHCVRCELSMGLTWKGTAPLIAGNGSVTGVSVVPEPGTLGLVATGLMSLAGLARRKLKLPI